MPELEFPDPPLADDVVLLRPWERADVPRNLMRFADPGVLRFCWSHVRDYTEADACGFFAHQAQTRMRGEELSFAFVPPREPRTVLGGGSVYDIDERHRRAAVGYWLIPAARGSGMATHATRLMARWAFDRLGIERLELTCGPDNAPSQGVAERCGFTREAVLRSHMTFKGARRDTLMFSLLAGELR